MLANYILLVLITFQGVMSDLKSVTLNLSTPLSDYFTTEYKQFDGVLYTLHKPKQGFKLDAVVDGSQKVWNGLDTYDKAKFVLYAYDKGVPSVLYVYTELFHYYKFFYTFVNGSWVKSNLSEYTKKLELMKKENDPEEFTMNLTTTSSTDKCELEPTSNFKKFDTFVPRNGYFATSVYHNVTLLWSSNMYGERCVAAWAFKYDDTHYLIRLLVTNAFDHFRFFNFVRVKNRWVDAESDAFGFVRADDTKFPEDFYYPQYFLSSSNRLLFQNNSSLTTTPVETNTLEKSMFMNPAYNFKPQNTKKDYDFKHHNSAIPYKNCHKLDFSKKVPGSFVYTKNVVLDKVLLVKTIYPKYGNFFGNVVDGNTTLYKRNVDSEACVGVHFYSKDKKYYLADVLVSSPHNPRSEYHVKEGNKWTSVTKASFLEHMEKLKA